MESKRFNAGPGKTVRRRSGAETGACGLRSCVEGGVVLRIVPGFSRDLAACPHAAGASARLPPATAAWDRYILAMPAKCLPL
ncbi:hypothetical protein SAMN05444050_1130 [Afipia sp. GAS231]|nr:hypothetical protein SAMN05444050_1130 [Afipia sp. GAS231]